ncbi:MAG: hypothetical protein II969_09780 [Anaerolineaceae bacterium]|nr:hypothetical protein [Anaerolineaceae bacterium]MBR0105383.1 hypothetical protein [Bacillota bacterium]
MSIVLEFITALGTVVAALSIISAFVLYKVQKRDEYLTKVRDSLQLISNDIEELNSLLNFELAYELASSLVYSKSSEYSLQRIFEICNEAIEQKKNEDETKELIKNALGIFGCSFQDALGNKYSNLISDIKQASIVFYPDYKGLFRFSKACSTFMTIVYSNYKKLLLSEDALSELIYIHLVKGSEPWDQFDHFQKSFLDCLVSIVEISRIEKHQKEINCLLDLVGLVYSTHIELSAKEWKKLAQKNKKITLQPYSDVPTITGDLREAEKCFAPIFSHDAIAKYASQVQIIELANDKDD